MLEERAPSLGSGDGGQHVEVAADRHVRDREQLRQLADADGASPPDLLEDQHLSLPG